jgi:predicted phosphatase
MTIKTKRIPEFESIEEEAEFWDTHDTADFEDEFRPVDIRVREDLSHGLVVQFDSQAFRQLSEQARKKRVGPTTLVQMWAMEHLRR